MNQISPIACGLSLFLKETNFCDFHHPAIQEIAAKIYYTHHTAKERAIAAFYFIRDNILWRFGDWNKKASETLHEREGSCSNKANLLVAILRAMNVPAAYGIMKVDGKNYFGPVIPEMFKKYIASVSTHVYATVYLGKWLKIDPTDDRMLCENVSHLTYTLEMVEWDGDKHAEVNLDRNHIYTDDFPIPAIDHLLGKRHRYHRNFRLELANYSLRFMRQEGRRIKDTAAVEPFIRQYLRRMHPFHYGILQLASTFEAMKYIIKSFYKYLSTYKRPN
jgi:hypothetical protein